jgi:hypothetical protein
MIGVMSEEYISEGRAAYLKNLKVWRHVEATGDMASGYEFHTGTHFFTL